MCEGPSFIDTLLHSLEEETAAKAAQEDVLLLRRRRSRSRKRRIRQHVASVITDLLDGSSSSSSSSSLLPPMSSSRVTSFLQDEIAHTFDNDMKEDEVGVGWQDSTLTDEVLLEILPLEVRKKRCNDENDCSFGGSSSSFSSRRTPLASDRAAIFPNVKRCHQSNVVDVIGGSRRKRRPLTSLRLTNRDGKNTTVKRDVSSDNDHLQIRVQWRDESIEKNTTSNDPSNHNNNFPLRNQGTASTENKKGFNDALFPRLETDAVQNDSTMTTKDNLPTFVTQSKNDEQNNNHSTTQFLATTRSVSRRKAFALANYPQSSAKNNKNILQEGAVEIHLPPTKEERNVAHHEREARIKKTQKRRNELNEARERHLSHKIEQTQLTKVEMAKKQKRLDREENFLELVSLVSITTKWFELSRDAMERHKIYTKWNNAAKSIQGLWRAELFLRNSKMAIADNRKLKKIGWRLKVWSRCTRRRLHAQLLRTFLEDFSVQQLNYIMYTFRYRVMKAQKIMRAFIECQRARRYALERYWAAMEKEVNQQNNSNRRGTNERRDSGRNKCRKNEEGMMTPQRTKSKARWNKLQIQSRAMLTLAAGLQSVGDKKKAKKMVDNSEIIKTICRYHLEDERRRHIDLSTKMLVENANLPAINVGHARMLLSGERVNVDFEGKRRWPSFLVYASSKKRLKKKVEALVWDGETVQRRMEERIESDRAAMTANRYAAGEESPIVGGCENDENMSMSPLNDKEEDGTGFLDNDVESTENSELEENKCLANRYKISTNDVQELREIFQLVRSFTCLLAIHICNGCVQQKWKQSM
uniref:Uncharacterized protein n=1 Tax=Ditylum brightwellii TaxID=49249 RepID=A0A7S4RH84_9STRA